jgi:hypothetical protein
LIYAHAGNQDFDASRYQTFPADADGIIPLTEMHWFEDDATHRTKRQFDAVQYKRLVPGLVEVDLSSCNHLCMI